MKKARAKRKANAERDMGAQKEKEIEKLKQKIEQLRGDVIKQKSVIKHFKIYQAFMDKVLDHTDEVRIVTILVPCDFHILLPLYSLKKQEPLFHDMKHSTAQKR